jgi:hypothetical protein
MPWPLRIVLDGLAFNGALLLLFGFLFWAFQGVATYRRLRDRWQQPTFRPVRHVYARVEHRRPSPIGRVIHGEDPAEVAEQLLATGRQP